MWGVFVGAYRVGVEVFGPGYLDVVEQVRVFRLGDWAFREVSWGTRTSAGVWCYCSHSQKEWLVRLASIVKEPHRLVPEKIRGILFLVLLWGIVIPLVDGVVVVVGPW